MQSVASVEIPLDSWCNEALTYAAKQEFRTRQEQALFYLSAYLQHDIATVERRPRVKRDAATFKVRVLISGELLALFEEGRKVCKEGRKEYAARILREYISPTSIGFCSMDAYEKHMNNPHSPSIRKPNAARRRKHR